MAKRSDFAQKLLDDLRVRKEHMAVTQSSGWANTTANIDVYRYSKQAYKGSSEKYMYKTTGSKTGSNTQKISDIHNKSLAIVDTRRDRSSQHMGDLSMALTLAQQDTGKLAGMDFSNSPNIISFLHQIGSRSMGSSIDKRSQLHVNEISKGALKLNQILKACGNNNASIRFDKDSIEVGKKLLKEAMDLEESLRMLVNLQEASGFMIKPQQKNRIRLLGDDDDDDDELEEEYVDNKLAVLDGPSRNSRVGNEGTRTGLSQRVEVLTYPAKVQASNLSGPDQEKKGVRNVIAKLMGLQEFPEHRETNYIAPKNPNLSQKILSVGSKKNEQRTTENDELKSQQPQNLENQKAIQSKKRIEPRNYMFVLQTDNNLLSTRSNIAVHDGKQLWTKSDNMEHSPQTTRSTNAAIKTDKERNIFTKQDNNDSTGKSETKAMVSKDESTRRVPQTYKISEAASVSIKKINHTENQHKRGNGKGLLHKNNIKISQSRGKKHVAEVKEHQTVKQKSQRATQNKNESYMKSTTKTIQDIIDLHERAPQKNQFMPDKKSHVEAIAAISNKRPTRMKEYENLANDEASTSSSVKLKGLVTSFVSARYKKPPVTQKNQKIEVAVTITNTNPSSLPRPIKSKISVLQEAKLKKDKSIIGPKIAEIASPGKSNEAESGIVNSNQRIMQLQLHQEDEEASACHSHVKDPHTQATNDNITISDVPDEGKVHTSGPNHELKPRAPVSTPLNDQQPSLDRVHSDINNSVTQERIPDSSYSSIMEIPESRNKEPLTDKEIHLKQILILNQQFLNAAEAFFKLNIPVGILLTTSSNYNFKDEQNKHILDCGYEILKRKGRRQELTVHPFATASMSFVKVISLNDLIKHIRREFEKLESYVVNGSSECDVEEYLAKMIGKDLYSEDADTNCMWDFGWNGGVSSFIDKDEVIRDIEKDLINEVIHEITVDFLRM